MQNIYINDIKYINYSNNYNLLNKIYNFCSISDAILNGV